jgi:16S rRNA (adenine1518-N6/adenine1519-N6)-dimethyltransferase
LTLDLAERARRLTAIELDPDLAGRLRSRVPANVEVVQADFLRIDLIETAAALRRASDRPTAPLRVAGNLPYVVSAPILLRLLRGAAAAGVRDAVVMLQREVAARVVANAGSRAYGPLAVMTALHADAGWLLDVPPGAFRPVPKVRSAVVSLRFRDPVRAPADATVFESLVRGLFTRRRKQLVNALAAFAPADGLDPRTVCRAAGLPPARRPDALDLPALIELADVLAAMTR